MGTSYNDPQATAQAHIHVAAHIIDVVVPFSSTLNWPSSDRIRDFSFAAKCVVRMRSEKVLVYCRYQLQGTSSSSPGSYSRRYTHKCVAIQLALRSNGLHQIAY